MRDSMISFSIIVPVYKVEQYLDDCVNSVLSQSYKNFELILVDDGSPDSCPQKCDEFQLSDQRVKVIHKKNGGLSSARNAGLDIASGTYIAFLDSDDFWDDLEALEEIACRLQETEADVMLFPAKKYYGDGRPDVTLVSGKIERSRIINSSQWEAESYLVQTNAYRAAAWNKYIKRSVIENNNLRFKDGYLSEDMDWCGDILVYANSFDWYEKPFYAYRQQREGSITNLGNEKLVADKIWMCTKGLKQAKELSDKKHEMILASYYAYEYSVALGLSRNVRDRETLRKMKKLRVLLNYDLSNKVKSVNKVFKLFGYEITRIILYGFVGLKNR